MQASIVCINSKNPSFVRNQHRVIEWLNNLAHFLTVYAKQRYGADLETSFYYPYYAPDSTDGEIAYEQLRAWDRSGWRDEYMGRGLQMYLGYGLDLAPHRAARGDNTAGYCETGYGMISPGAPRQILPDAMTYIDMPAYEGSAMPTFNGGCGCWQYVGKTCMHEFDHWWLGYLADPRYITGVHAAAVAPLERWSLSGYVEPADAPFDLTKYDKDSFGNPIWYLVQQDPRKF